MPKASVLYRFIAMIIDSVVVCVPFFVVLAILAKISMILAIPFYIAFPIIFWLYYTKMESSEKQATIGKILMKIKVTDENGNRLTETQAATRAAARVLSGFTIVGFLIPFVSETKQALHDVIAKTLVVESERDQ